MRGVPMQQQMAPLPLFRASNSLERKPPFQVTMMDLAGPFYVTVRRKREKRWILLLTCANYRAIHLESLPGMSADKFILGFCNFINRRPRPMTCYSDNGRNFVGAAGVLKKTWSNIMNDQVRREFPQTDFRFNPPSSPHFGGAVERMVKSVKNALKMVLPGCFSADDRAPAIQDQAFQTALTTIETIINSRPLSYKAESPDELSPITPADFLGGHRTHELLPYMTPTNLTKSWRVLNMILDSFWIRFVKEVTPNLHQWNKWTGTSRNLQVNDIVVVLDEAWRGCWALGKIVEVFAYKKDGLIRSARVKTQLGTHIKPITKLSLLLKQEDDQCTN